MKNTRKIVIKMKYKEILESPRKQHNYLKTFPQIKIAFRLKKLKQNIKIRKYFIKK